MKIKLNAELTAGTMDFAFNKAGVPTKAAEEAMEAGKTKGIDGLNHGGTGFSQPTGTFFDGVDGKRELYFGGNFTSHLVKATGKKPTL